jgi:hypothetical protein
MPPFFVRKSFDFQFRFCFHVFIVSNYICFVLEEHLLSCIDVNH